MVEEWWMPYLAWGVLALAAGAVCSLLWLCWPARNFWAGQPWRPHHPGGGEVWLFFLFLSLVPPLVQSLLQAAGFFKLVYGQEPTLSRQFLWVVVPALPLILLGTWPILNMRHPARLEDIGVSGQRGRDNLLMGYLAWLVLTPPILAIHLALNSIWEGPQHPFVRLSQESLLPLEWCLLVFQAVVFASLVEELAFRGVLQSWLYRASPQGHWVLALAAVLLAALPVLAELCRQVAPLWFPEPRHTVQGDEASPPHGTWIFALLLAGVYLLTARRWRPAAPAQAPLPSPPLETKPPGGLQESQSPPPAADQKAAIGNPDAAPRALPAIVGSAFFWAVIHSWPTPIPLFFLGLGLGWLSYRTQNLIGPVVAHALFNAVACLVLGLMKWLGE